MLPEKASLNAPSIKIECIRSVIEEEINKHDKILHQLHLYIDKVDKHLNKLNAQHPGNISMSNLTRNNPQECSEKNVSKPPHTREVETILHVNCAGKTIQKQQFVEKCSHIYTFLESLFQNECAMSNSSRAKLRKAQGDIQRIRLWLLDVANAKATIL